MSISLHDVNKDNWKQIVKLKLADGQENFVAPNWYSILQAHFEFGYARAIYLDDTPIGLPGTAQTRRKKPAGGLSAL